MNELAEFRREHQTVTREVAEDYFNMLTYMITGCEHSHLIKTDRIYFLLDRYLLKNHNEYHESNPEDRHIRLKDYTRSLTKGKTESTTLFERFPAIRRQLDDLLEMPKDTIIRFVQKKDFAINEPKTMYMVHNFIEQGCYYPGHIFPGRYSPYVDQNTFEKVLREETFVRGEKLFDTGSEKDQMEIWKGSRRIFPNARFVKSIREIVEWDGKCKQVGFNPSEIIVRADARRPYVYNDDRDDGDSGYRGGMWGCS